MVERERIVEIVAAVAAVLVMIGAMLWIGFTYGAENGFTEEGTHLLVGAIVGFILLLTAVGAGLAFALNDPEDGADGTDDAEARSAA